MSKTILSGSGYYNRARVYLDSNYSLLTQDDKSKQKKDKVYSAKIFSYIPSSLNNKGSFTLLSYSPQILKNYIDEKDFYIPKSYYKAKSLHTIFDALYINSFKPFSSLSQDVLALYMNNIKNTHTFTSIDNFIYVICNLYCNLIKKAHKNLIIKLNFIKCNYITKIKTKNSKLNLFKTYYFTKEKVNHIKYTNINVIKIENPKTKLVKINKFAISENIFKRIKDIKITKYIYNTANVNNEKFKKVEYIPHSQADFSHIQYLYKDTYAFRKVHKNINSSKKYILFPYLDKKFNLHYSNTKQFLISYFDTNYYESGSYDIISYDTLIIDLRTPSLYENITSGFPPSIYYANTLGTIDKRVELPTTLEKYDYNWYINKFSVKNKKVNLINPQISKILKLGYNDFKVNIYGYITALRYFDPFFKEINKQWINEANLLINLSTTDTKEKILERYAIYLQNIKTINTEIKDFSFSNLYLENFCKILENSLYQFSKQYIENLKNASLNENCSNIIFTPLEAEAENYLYVYSNYTLDFDIQQSHEISGIRLGYLFTEHNEKLTKPSKTKDKYFDINGHKLNVSTNINNALIINNENKRRADIYINTKDKYQKLSILNTKFQNEKSKIKTFKLRYYIDKSFNILPIYIIKNPFTTDKNGYCGRKFPLIDTLYSSFNLEVFDKSKIAILKIEKDGCKQIAKDYMYFNYGGKLLNYRKIHILKGNLKINVSSQNVKDTALLLNYDDIKKAIGIFTLMQIGIHYKTGPKVNINKKFTFVELPFKIPIELTDNSFFYFPKPYRRWDNLYSGPTVRRASAKLSPWYSALAGKKPVVYAITLKYYRPHYKTVSQNTDGSAGGGSGGYTSSGKVKLDAPKEIINKIISSTIITKNLTQVFSPIGDAYKACNVAALSHYLKNVFVQNRFLETIPLPLYASQFNNNIPSFLFLNNKLALDFYSIVDKSTFNILVKNFDNIFKETNTLYHLLFEKVKYENTIKTKEETYISEKLGEFKILKVYEADENKKENLNLMDKFANVFNLINKRELQKAFDYLATIYIKHWDNKGFKETEEKITEYKTIYLILFFIAYKKLSLYGLASKFYNIQMQIDNMVYILKKVQELNDHEKSYGGYFSKYLYDPNKNLVSKMGYPSTTVSLLSYFGLLTDRFLVL